MPSDLTGLGTFALALVTVVIIVQTWHARQADAADRAARSIRAAVREQLDSLRAWSTLDPERGDVERLVRLADLPLPIDRVTAMIDSVDVPEDLAVYLIWVLGELSRLRGELEGSVAPYSRITNREARISPVPDTILGTWRVTLELQQVLLCLIQGEARRRGRTRLADLGAGMVWVQPRPRPGDMRAGDRLAQELYLQAPPFPKDPAYARCDVGPREAEARRLAAVRNAAYPKPEQPSP